MDDQQPRRNKRSASPSGASCCGPARGYGHGHGHARAGSEATPGPADRDDKQSNKRQRIRPVLACIACKRRKIRCDRNLPCEACVKRGDGDKCEWDPQVEPERSKYALAEEVERLQDRLATLESALRNPISSNICCPASCSCHEEPKSRPRGAPLAAGEDLPLSQLIDQKLGFKRDLDAVDSPILSAGGTGQGCCSSETETGIFSAISAGPSSASSVWLESSVASANGKSGTRLPIFAHFGKDLFVSIINSALPGKAQCDALLQAYFKDFDWACHVLHAPSFHREYASFWSHPETHRVSLVDPAWLALLMIMLALGVRCLSEAGLPEGLRNHSLGEVGQWPDLFFECSQMALKQAHWTRRPQIRVLQTILLFLSYLDFTSEGPDTLIWIGAAVKIAHLLGLHRLDTDEYLMPSDDLAIPSVSGTMKRQLAYRLWICLLSADMMASTSRRQPLGIWPIKDEALRYLVNCNDDDLQVDGHAQAADSNIITDVTFEVIKYRLGMHQHQYAEMYSQAGGSLSAHELGKLDRNLRAIMDGIDEPALPPGGPPFSSGISLLVRRYYMISSAVHYRILRLHRPYMNRGYVDPEHRSSTSACVESALAILTAINKFRVASTSTNWFFTLHCIEAVLVVFVDIFWKMDHHVSKGAIERNKQDLLTAQATFSAATASFSPQVEQIARLGQALLTKLLEEETARSMVPVKHREPLSEVFKRTASTLMAPSSPGNAISSSATGLWPMDPMGPLFPTNGLPPSAGTVNMPDFSMINDVFGDFFMTDYQSYGTMS